MNINGTVNCYGCGVCSVACPKGIISIELNEDGFYEPRIREIDRCVQCGLCIDVCGFHHNELAQKTVEIKSWASWSNNVNYRKKCSSGGIGYEIGRSLIKQGYKSVGCRYNIKEQRAEHYVASTIEELAQSIGSKYLQSYTESAFKQIKLTQEKYLVVGTPCQMDSFRRMIQKFHCEDNFVLMDFFCHSVPSLLGWQYYIKTIPEEIGMAKFVSWRNKEKSGWHDSYRVYVKGENNDYVSYRSTGDLFFKLYLDDLCIGPQCVKDCKYKYTKSSADIRIGDFWGDTYKHDEDGVSAVISFTKKGRGVVESLSNVTLIEHPIEIVAEGQMKTNAKGNLFRNLIVKQLKRKGSIDSYILLASSFLSKLSRINKNYSNLQFIKKKLISHI